MNIDEFYKNYWELLSYRNEYRLPKTVLNVYNDSNENEVLMKIVSVINMSIGSIILDIGAGNRKLYDLLKKENFQGRYKSFDIAGKSHDFHSLDEINDKFDAVFMMELIEHLELDHALSYLSKAYSVLKDNGFLIISTPNIDHINQLWKQDVTHIRQYPAKDIYSILRMIGFGKKIQIFRVYLTNKKRSLKLIIKEKLKIYLTKILDVDYAHGILVIAKKEF